MILSGNRIGYIDFGITGSISAYSRETGIWPERDVIKYIRSAIAIDGPVFR
jgi:hypothetical protein